MAVPARRTSRSKSKSRRKANSKKNLVHYNFCKNCGEVKIPYYICKKCGFYNFQNILYIKNPSNTSIK